VPITETTLCDFVASYDYNAIYELFIKFILVDERKGYDWRFDSKNKNEL
jgi:hypothetical protein